MEGSLADELYSETLRLSNVELGQTSTAKSKQCDSNDCDGDDWWHEDGSSWEDSNEELDKASDLDREWQKRRQQFHTIGYRDGLTAGKEASAQEGFNIGFKESVHVGYNWGLVRGVTSALSCLPDELKEMLVETQEKRNKFWCLNESVHSLSTADALKLFHDDILTNKSVEQSEDAEPSSRKADLHDQGLDGSLLGSYHGELQSLLLESPAIEVHLEMGQ
uniref:Essential protein Yae1 N-terminal domain-containing protein n=1 Tax=Davidia involucrata TaxID=16924 RepID=A0A5B7BR35_DAVIN